MRVNIMCQWCALVLCVSSMYVSVNSLYMYPHFILSNYTYYLLYLLSYLYLFHFNHSVQLHLLSLWRHSNIVLWGMRLRSVRKY